MNNIPDQITASLINPQIEDWNSFNDFRDGLADNAPKIESLLAELKRSPDDGAKITSLFRLFHNIKGDAGLCRLNFVIPLVHGVETLLSRMRAGEVALTDFLGDVILLTLDRLEQCIAMLAEGQNVSALALPALADGLNALSQQEPQLINAAAARLIEAVTGFKPSAARMAARHQPEMERSIAETHQDLRFFRELSLQLDQRSPLYQGRTTRKLELALATNLAAGNRVDPQQLEAAVYLHDIGMMFLPESMWLKTEKLSDEARQQMARHPAWSAEWANRIAGWQDAAQMILQHHEQINGSGYPNGLTANEICDGAKILALVDAFDAILLRHSHRGQQKSTLRAIAEINAGDRQFAADWIAAFNRVIRTQLEAGHRA
ncbi:HD domain-containing protein [Chitinibacter bivalviorum]|uniref:HD domain-containing protein n=1 Tax=Chitinibacter bivalviorum TaxID=2739434 RepID=A0A7H9BF80_9NEIS|nr:HD domain-containing phosphohydrolase [Chitinibacter bivalviorum]QLG87360.1 HD domain-containing protein [Chitinibacter bivalviorum]